MPERHTFRHAWIVYRDIHNTVQIVWGGKLTDFPPSSGFLFPAIQEIGQQFRAEGGRLSFLEQICLDRGGGVVEGRSHPRHDRGNWPCVTPVWVKVWRSWFAYTTEGYPCVRPQLGPVLLSLRLLWPSQAIIIATSQWRYNVTHLLIHTLACV